MIVKFDFRVYITRNCVNGFICVEDDVKTVEVLIEMDHQEPSWWVLVTDDMIPSNVEEHSAIDNEHYIVVNEEHVVDAVAHFLAKCIMSNPKAKVSYSYS